MPPFNFRTANVVEKKILRGSSEVLENCRFSSSSCKQSRMEAATHASGWVGTQHLNKEMRNLCMGAGSGPALRRVKILDTISSKG